jgi:hypothetical protein
VEKSWKTIGRDCVGVRTTLKGRVVKGLKVREELRIGIRPGSWFEVRKSFRSNFKVRKDV